MGTYLAEDLKRLLSNIQNERVVSANKDSLHEEFRTIMGICNEISAAKDVLREVGGLSCLMDFACSTSNDESMEWSLKTLSCAIDQNVSNQQEITRSDIFILIRNTLARDDVSPSLLKTAVLLTSTILYQNAIAHSMFRETGCLQCCADLYQEVFPPFMLGHVSVKIDNTDLKLASTEMWQAVNTALCFSMTNPANSSNQAKCVHLLPIALRILRCSSYHEILCSISAFLSALIRDNGKNLRLFVKHDGLPILKHCLEVGVMSILANKAPIGLQGDIQATISIISLIDLCIVENEENSRILAQSGVMPLLSKVLVIDRLDDNSKTKILLTLGHFIEACKENIGPMLAEGNLKSFFKKNCKSGDDDLLKSCQYVIHLLLTHDKSGNTSKTKGDLKSNWPCDWSTTSVSCVTEFHAKKTKLAGALSPPSSTDSSDELSRIELSKTKEKRIHQYLTQVYNYNHKKSSHLSSKTVPLERTTQKVETAASCTSNLSRSKKVSYFNKKFGCHQSLSTLTRSAANTARAECNSRKSYALSDAGDKLDGGDFERHSHYYSSGRRLSSLFSNNSRQCPYSNQHDFHNSGEQMPHLQTYQQDSSGDNHHTQETTYFLKPTGLPPKSRSIAVQMPTPVIKSNFRNTPLVGKKTNARSGSSDIAGDSEKRRASFYEKSSSEVQPYSRDTVDSVRRISKLRKSSVSGQTLSFSPFEKDFCSYSGTAVNVLKYSPSKGTAASRLLAKLQKSNAEHKVSSLKGNTSTTNSDDGEPFFDVLVFPASKCSKHGLISSHERLWFKPVAEN